MQEIGDSNVEKDAAKLAIDNITALGGTNIGSGLNLGRDDLFLHGISDGTPTGQPDPLRVIILLSDGYGNGYNSTVSQNLTTAAIIVHTVGVGTDVNHDLMKKIASEHGGDYQWAVLPKIYYAFNRVREKLYGQTVVKSISGAVTAGTMNTEDVIGNKVLE